MPGHDLIVIGGSAGSLEPLKELVAGLPADLPAAVCITRHASPHAPNVLPQILAKAGELPAVEAMDGAALQPSHIYVAPPDCHLLVQPGLLRVTRSPTENRFRPAIDPLFRSAAVAYGPRVIGVLLSGALDDGTAGLWAVKQRGGIAVVQDPTEALQAAMLQSALTYVPVDHCVTAVTLAPLLVRLVHTAVPDLGGPPITEEMAMENQIALEDNALESGLMRVGQLSPFTCPDCHGVLLQLKAGRLLHFRCHTGHAFTAQSLLAALRESIDDTFWNTVRALDESVMLMQHTAAHLQQAGHEPGLAAQFTQQAAATRQQSEVIRQLVMQHHTRRPPLGVEDAPKADEARDLPDRRDEGFHAAGGDTA
jgi:two-component system chemotaxis response regulator CheB